MRRIAFNSLEIVKFIARYVSDVAPYLSLCVIGKRRFFLWRLKPVFNTTNWRIRSASGVANVLGCTTVEAEVLLKSKLIPCVRKDPCDPNKWIANRHDLLFWVRELKAGRTAIVWAA